MDILGQLKKKLHGVEAQINPLDNGQTYSSVVNTPSPSAVPHAAVPMPHPSQTPAPTPSASHPSFLQRAFNQVNIADGGKTWSNPVAVVPKIKAPEGINPNAPPAQQFAQANQRTAQLTQQTTQPHDFVTQAGKFLESSIFKPAANLVAGTVVEPARSVVAQITGNEGAQQAAEARKTQNIDTSLPAEAAKGIVQFGNAARYAPTVLNAELHNRPIPNHADTKGLTALNQSYLAPALSGPEKIIADNIPGARAASEQAGFDPNQSISSTLSQTGLGALQALAPDYGLIRPGVRAGRAAAGVLKSTIESPALTAAERTSGLPRDSVINENEAGTLRDFADYKTGEYRPDANTANGLHMQARNAAQTAGIDITSGSPADVTNRIYDYLGKRKRFVDTHSMATQGGFVKVPGVREIAPEEPVSARQPSIPPHLTPDIPVETATPAQMQARALLTERHMADGMKDTEALNRASTEVQALPPEQIQQLADERGKALFGEGTNSSGRLTKELPPEAAQAIKSLVDERRTVWKQLAPARQVLKSLAKQRDQLDILARQHVAAGDVEGAKQIRFEHADLTYKHQLAANKERELSRAYADTKKRELEIRQGLTPGTITDNSQPPITDTQTPKVTLSENGNGPNRTRNVMVRNPETGKLEVHQELYQPEARNLEDQIAQGKVRIAEFDPKLDPGIQKQSEHEFETLKERGLMGDYILDKGILKKRYSKPDVVDKEGKGVARLTDGGSSYKRVRNAVITDEENRIVGVAMGGKLIDPGDLAKTFDGVENWSDARSYTKNIDKALEAAAPSPEDYHILRDWLIVPREQAVSDMNRAWNDTNKEHAVVIQDLGVKGKKLDGVMADLQHYGEQTVSRADLVKKYGEDLTKKIDSAVVWYRNTFDGLLDLANKTLKEYGYDPIPKRDNYFTHFREEGTWSKFGIGIENMLKPTKGNLFGDINVNGARSAVPESFVGKTGTLAPGKKFNQYALRRNGGEFTPHAGKSLEEYLPNILNNIYITPSIIRGRVLERAIELTNKDRGTLSRFVNGLREYNNSLAGKTTRLDRFVVDTAGKGVLDTLGVLQGLRGRSSILGNVGSAIVQVSALPQAYGVANPKNFMLAALEQAKAAVKDDPHDPMLQSRFMNIRYSDVKNNFRTKFSKAQDILGSPLEMVEKASTEIVWRSMYNKALSTGLKGDAAILEADRLTSRTAGSRNFGDKSELMRTKALGPVTQFKLEVFNTAQQIASRGGELNPLHHPVRFLNFAIAAAALGAGLQVVLGRDPIIDPLHALAQAGKGLFGKDPNNEYGSGAIAPVNVALDQVLNNVPFGPEIAQGLNLKKSADGSNDFLKGTDFDKFGYSNTVSSLAQQLINAASKHDAASTEKLAASFVPAGGQILKGVQGVQTVNKGVTDSDGVVTTEVPKNPLNYAKSVLFGKNSIPEVQQSYDASNGGIASSGKLGDALRLNTKQEKQLQVQFKKSLTPEQNDLRKLSADERATLVNEGAVTTDQLADVDRKVLAAKKQLGIVPGVGGQTVPKLPGNTPQTVKDFYKERAYIYDGDLKDWQGKKAQGNAKALIDTANQIVPEGAPAIPQTNQVAELYADFAKRRADAKWGAEKENVEKGKFLSQIYKSTLSSQQQEWYGLSDTNLQTAIDNGEITAPDLDGLVSFDDQMRKFGLPGGIGNTLRKDYGYQEWSAPGAKPKNGKKFSLPASYFNNAATVGSFRKLITNAKLKGGK